MKLIYNFSVNNYFLLLFLTLFLPYNANSQQGLKDFSIFSVGTLYQNDDAVKSGSPAKYFQVAHREFNQATIGALDWYYSHKQENVFDFSEADNIIPKAQQAGMSVYGDHLVWYAFSNSGFAVGWLRDFNRTNAEFTAITKKHIDTIVGRYAGRIIGYNAVNEPFEDDGRLRKSHHFYTKIGPGYIDSAFRWANAADPHAKLFLNEYDLETSPVKLDSMLAYVRGMRTRGVPIHGLGTQMHIKITQSKRGIDEMFRKMAATGLQVFISELDIAFTSGDIVPYFVPSEEEKRQQSELFRYVAESYMRNVPPSQRFGLNMWAFTDKVSWIRSSFTGPYDYPCLFDDNMDPKVPAYNEFKKGLQFLTNTELPGRLQAENAALSPGVIVVTGNDVDQTKQVILNAGQTATFTTTVTKAGIYPLTLRALGTNARLSVSIDGQPAIPLTINSSSFIDFPTSTLQQLVLSPVLTTGTHTIKVSRVTGTVILNWIASDTRFTTIPAKIQAEDNNVEFGATTSSGRFVDDDNTPLVAFNRNGFAEYKLYVPDSGVYYFNLRVSNAATTIGAIDIISGLTRLATVSVPPTGNNKTFETITVPINLQAGFKSVSFVFKSTGLSMNWVNVKDYHNLPGKIEAEHYAVQTATQIITTGVDADGSKVVRLNTGGVVTYPVYTGINQNSTVMLRAKGSGNIEVKIGNAVTAISINNDTQWKYYTANINVSAGKQTLTLKSLGGTTEVNWMSIAAYNKAPGIVQAEDFSDSKGVRVIASGGNDITGTLAYLQPQDYVLYAVDVKTAGTYIATYHAKSYVQDITKPVSTIKMEYNGNSRTDTVPFTDYNYSNVSFSIELPAGINYLRISFPQGDINLDYIDIADTKYYGELIKKLTIEKGLPTGAFNIGGQTENAVLQTRGSYGGTFTPTDLEGQIFSKSLVVTNPNSQETYSTGLDFASTKPIAQNDVLLAVFYARCTTCDVKGKAKLGYLVQHSGTFNTYFERYNDNSVSSEWKIYYMPFQAAAAQAVGQLKVAFHLGYTGQTIELGGFALINYKDSISLADLQKAVAPNYYDKLKEKLELEAGLQGGTYILGTTTETVIRDNAFTTLYGANKINADVSNQIFSKSIQLTATSTEFTYSAGMAARTEAPATANDVLLGVFYARCTACDAQGKAKITYQVKTEQNTYPVFRETEITSSWQIVYLPLQLAAAQSAGAMEIGFNLGYPNQSIELAGFAIINYRNNITLEALTNALSGENKYYTLLKEKLQTEKNLIGGDYVLGGVSESATIANSIYQNGGNFSTVDVSNQIFKKALQVTATQTGLPGSCTYATKSTAPIAQNDVLLAVYYARCTSCGPNGKSTFKRFTATTDFADFFTATWSDDNSITLGWQIYYVPFQASKPIDVDKLMLFYHLGYPNQTIEIAGFAVINYKNVYTLEQLNAAVAPDYYVKLKQKLETDKGLTGGDYVIGGTTEMATLDNSIYKFGATFTNLDVTNQIFTKGMEVKNAASSPSSTAYATKSVAPVDQNDVLLAVFYARCTTCDANGKASFKNFIATTDFADFFLASSGDENTITSDWKIFYLPFQASKAVDIDKLMMFYHLGYAGQTIEMAGFSVINYRSTYTLQQLQTAITPASDYYTLLRQKIEADKGFTGGEFVIGGTSEAFTIDNSIYKFGGTFTNKDVSNQIFTKSMEVKDAASSPASTAYATKSVAPIAQNDVLMSVFYARCTSCDANGNASFKHFTATTDFSDFFAATWNDDNSITADWKIYYVPFQASRAVDADNLMLFYHLGYPNQTIELAGFSVINYKNAYTLAQLSGSAPSNVRMAAAKLVTAKIDETMLVGKATIYPNPSNGHFTLQYDMQQQTMLEVYSLDGKLVYSRRLTDTKAFLHTVSIESKLSKGMYFIKLNEGGKITTQKLIIR